MNGIILAAVLSINTTLTLINEDLSYLSDADVAAFREECKARELTSFAVHSTDGKVSQIKCYSEKWDTEFPS